MGEAHLRARRTLALVSQTLARLYQVATHLLALSRGSSHARAALSLWVLLAMSVGTCESTVVCEGVSDHGHCSWIKDLERGCQSDEHAKESCAWTCCNRPDVPLPSMSEAEQLQALADAAPRNLRPTNRACSTATPCTPFYLEEEYGLEMHAVRDCFLRRNQLSAREGEALKVDDHVFAGEAQHLTDLALLHQLRNHPLRTFNRSAAIHFTGILPTVSWMLDQYDRSHGCNIGTHDERMQGATIGLGSLLEQLDDDDERIYVFVSTHWDPRGVLGAVYDLMQQQPRRLLIAGSDTSFVSPHDGNDWLKRFGDLRPNFVTTPYAASYRLDDKARMAATTCDPSRREHSFFFAGTMQRTSTGQLRESVMRTMANGNPRAMIVDHNIEENHVAFRDEARMYAERMLSARYCLVPAGDTATSRRLYDALAAGCHPVTSTNFNM